MINLFTPFRSFLKFADVSTDNIVFRLHYRLSVILLLVFTLLITSKQYFGDPIYCMGGTPADKDAINSYCWILGAYNLKSQLRGIGGIHNAYVGVGPHNVGVGPHNVGGNGEVNDEDDKISQTYYQWVCFILLGQAAMFYAPRWLWKMWEGGRLKALAAGLANPMVSNEWKESKRGDLVTYLNYTNLYTHSLYAYRYAICEILNFVNVVSQIFLLDKFFGGSFRNYGAAVAAFTSVPKTPSDVRDSVNPMDIYFPKFSKCLFKSYGTSGSIETKDRLCVLTLNIVNEKIFLVLWFWLIILAVISGIAVCYRLVIICVPKVRTYVTMGHVRYVRHHVVSKTVNRFGYGDWFILYLLGKNMNPIIYKDLLLELTKEIEEKPLMA